MNLPVVQYNAPYVPNPNPKGETPFEEFWKVRMAVLAASRQVGSTGPEDSTIESPRYWLVDDQYNDDLYQNMEVYEADGWNIDWITALVACLHEHSGWAISIGGCDRGHVLLYADRVLVTGPAFSGCNSLVSVVEAAKAAAEEYDERKYGPLRRQLEYIERLLPDAMPLARKDGFTCLATFNGYELFEGHAIWILQTERYDQFALDIESSPIRSSAVSKEGSLLSSYSKDFWPYTDLQPPFWLVTYLVEDQSQTRFNMVREDTGVIAPLEIARVISDEELKRQRVAPE